METAIQAAMMADSWASRFFGSEPGEFLGLAWEAASRVAPQFSRRKAVLAINMAALAVMAQLGKSVPQVVVLEHAERAMELCRVGLLLIPKNHRGQTK